MNDDPRGRNAGHPKARLKVGTVVASVLFVCMLVAFVAESEITQYIESSLGYRQPFFLFFVAHSSFFITFPLHLLYLTQTNETSVQALFENLSIALNNQLLPGKSRGNNTVFPYRPFLRLSLLFTAGITLPGLLWFASVSLASISDVTALWNTNAFWAYVISVQFSNSKWETRKLAAVVVATAGVSFVVYSGEELSKAPENAPSARDHSKPTAPLLGDLLTLIASIGLGFYQVLYKKYVALPDDPEHGHSAEYSVLENGDFDEGSDAGDDLVADSHLEGNELPFGFHPNFFTSSIGLCTFLVLWTMLPILHFLGWETFRLPPTWEIVFAMCGMALTGVIFNSCFMILLGVWGPIVTSVGNLLTIVLVLVSDVLLFGNIGALTLWSVLGCCMIVGAFVILSHNILQSR